MPDVVQLSLFFLSILFLAPYIYISSCQLSFPPLSFTSIYFPCLKHSFKTYLLNSNYLLFRSLFHKQQKNEALLGLLILSPPSIVLLSAILPNHYSTLYFLKYIALIILSLERFTRHKTSPQPIDLSIFLNVRVSGIGIISLRSLSCRKNLLNN